MHLYLASSEQQNVLLAVVLAWSLARSSNARNAKGPEQQPERVRTSRNVCWCRLSIIFGLYYSASLLFLDLYYCKTIIFMLEKDNERTMVMQVSAFL